MSAHDHDSAARDSHKKNKIEHAHITPKPRKPDGTKKEVDVDYNDVEAIPLFTQLVSNKKRRLLQSIWSPQSVSEEEPKNHHSRNAEAPSKPKTLHDAIPPHRVGTKEMYKRFPEAYDIFMQHHQCEALYDYLADHVLARLHATHSPSPSPARDDSAPPPWLRVLDMGCGTGRLEQLLVQPRAQVAALYGYDKEVSMLQVCLEQTVRYAAVHNHSRYYDELVLLPHAGCHSTDDGVIRFSASAGVQEAEEDKQPMAPRHTLSLCLRPCTFEHLQAQFLSRTHHPRCQLIVCAWALSYVVRQAWGGERWHAQVDSVLQALLGQLDTSTSDAALVIIETLGNNTTTPTRHNTLIDYMEGHYGFESHWVRTDYVFPSLAEGERAVQFFFGKEMAAKMKETHRHPEEREKEGAAKGGACRLLECTGIWILWKEKGT